MPQARTPPPWRAAFLRELARGGNVKLAADLSGIDKTTAYALRKRNPAFAKSWTRAVAQARSVLGDGAIGPSAKRPKLEADQVLRPARDGRVCIVRAGAGRWSAKAEAVFLAELATSANIAAAARAAGFSTVAVYARRRLWPEFAHAWRAALREGYDRLEADLLCAATTTLNPEPTAVMSEAPPMSIDQALNLLKLHRAALRGGKPQRYDWRAQEPDIEEVRAEVLRRLAVTGRGRSA